MVSDDTKTPVTNRKDKAPVRDEGDVDAFLAQVRAMPKSTGGPRGRLIFALDATMSRQPTWDHACQLQGEMFAETAKIGGLDVQLVFFRGFGECRASRWVNDATELAGLMSRVDCRGGHTQISKVLKHAISEARERKKVNAVVYVGDCMEEDVDNLCTLAGEVGLLGVPFFMFQEGREPGAEHAFREIARLTRGAYCRFDPGSAHRLRELLSAVAVYAAGGRAALEDYSRAKGSNVAGLLEQMS